MRLFPVIPLLLSSCVSTASLELQPAEHRLAAQRRALVEERARLFEAELERPAPAPKRTAVLLVLDAEDATGRLTDKEIASLSTYLGLIAVERAGYRVTPRGLLVEELRRQKAASLAPCVDEACRIEIGKALAADRVLSARIFHDGTGCVLGLTLLGLRTETAKWGRLESAACALSSLYRAAERAVGELPQAEESKR